MALNPPPLKDVFHLSPPRDRPSPAFPLGLGEAGVHELCEASHGDFAALTGFALAARTRSSGPVVWIRQASLKQAHGTLLRAGCREVTADLPPSLDITPRKLAEALWAKAMTDPAIEIDNGPHQGRVLQRIAPASYTPGHARLMPVAMKETSAQRAATHGWPAFIPAFTPPRIGGTEPFVHVKKFFDNYHAKLTAAGHPEDVVNGALDWTTHTYQCVHVAESDDQAREELEVILKAYHACVEREAEFNARAESNAENTKTDRTPNALTEDWIGTWCLYGSPETVIEHLRPYKELGIGNVLCGTTTGPLTEERLRLGNQTLDLLAREVMPALA